MSSPAGNVSSTYPSPTRNFVAYLEGIRGLSALYVVLFHVRSQLDPEYAFDGPAGSLLPFHLSFFMYGHYAVGIFIVLSGFVLSLPVVDGRTLPGGIAGFFKRRARRLFPAYYAALVLSVPSYLALVHFYHATTSVKNVLLQIAAHALFVENLHPRLASGIDGPMWSVATEVQIYVVFALLLLPAMRRFGVVAMVAVAFLLGMAPTAYALARHHVSAYYPLAEACYWYLALFAFGAAAANVCYGTSKRLHNAFERVPWALAAFGLWIAFGSSAVALYARSAWHPEYAFTDMLLGAAMSATMIAIHRAGPHSPLAVFFSWKPFLVLGSFSYSLYLIHDPIVLAVMAWVAPKAPIVRIVIGFGIVPGIVALAYVFARFFEFPYLSRFRREAEVALARGDGTPMGVAVSAT